MRIPAEFLGLITEAAVLLQGGRIAYANAGAAALLGPDCVGKPVRECFGPEIAGIQSDAYSACMKIGGRHCILRTAVIDGMQAILFSESADISRDVNSSFYAAVNSALMDISINTAMGVSLADELKNPELKRCFNSMRINYYKLTRLFSNIQLAEKLMNGTQSVTLRSTDLAKLCSAYFEPLMSMYPNIEFRLSLPQRMPVVCDRQLVSCALTNLVSNSLRHAENVSCIGVTLYETERSAIIAVSDNGSGIAPDIMPTVFFRYTAASELSDGLRGAGLGLTIARGTADLHEGTLMLESRRSIGTTVRLSISKELHADGSAYVNANETIAPLALNELCIGFADCLPENMDF